MKWWACWFNYIFRFKKIFWRRTTLIFFFPLYGWDFRHSFKADSQTQTLIGHCSQACGKSCWISIEYLRDWSQGCSKSSPKCSHHLFPGVLEVTQFQADTSMQEYLLWKHNSKYHFYFRCANIISKIILVFNDLNISLFILPLGFEMRVKIIEAIVVVVFFFLMKSLREEIKWIAYMKKINKFWELSTI